MPRVERSQALTTWSLPRRRRAEAVARATTSPGRRACSRAAEEERRPLFTVVSLVRRLEVQPWVPSSKVAL